MKSCLPCRPREGRVCDEGTRVGWAGRGRATRTPSAPTIYLDCISGCDYHVAVRIVGKPVAQKKEICMLCGRPSPKRICDACSDKVRGEALNKKKKEEKAKP